MQKNIKIQKNKNTEISVIMVIYNTPELYLRKSIESIINQTKKDIEIILVNDGSNEKVKNICTEYENKDKRIILINQNNQGESVARNVGMEKANGNYITFVDSDDWIEPNLCDKICQLIEKLENKADIIFFDCYVHQGVKKIKNYFYNKEGFLNKEDIEEIKLQNIEKGIVKYYPIACNISVVWAKVYKKNFIKQNNLKFTPEIVRMPDALFNMEAFEKTKNIYYNKESLYHYNKNNFSVCQKFDKKTIIYFEKYFNIVEDYIKKYQKGQQFVDTLNIKKITSIENYMNNYFFHKDNPYNKQQIEQEFTDLLNNEMYKIAFELVNKKYLSIYQRLLLKYYKKQDITKLKQLNKLKKIIRGETIFKS